MKLLLGLFLSLSFLTIGCSKDSLADTTDHTDHACKCDTVVSEPVWKYGTLCGKGELTQGHGVNKDGKIVSGCVTLKSSCVCPH